MGLCRDITASAALVMAPLLPRVPALILIEIACLLLCPILDFRNVYLILCRVHVSGQDSRQVSASAFSLDPVFETTLLPGNFFFRIRIWRHSRVFVVDLLIRFQGLLLVHGVQNDVNVLTALKLL